MLLKPPSESTRRKGAMRSKAGNLLSENPNSAGESLETSIPEGHANDLVIEWISAMHPTSAKAPRPRLSMQK